ncbi:putative toxin biosynthesis protein [Daldinia childiae]|uniref:putative toxin biosynthesis protein n=1 Tax=Daldinia childiae TaxID=326645 RepID=UPI001444C994|nr:putative toxin biosynthesis protein [Daldinia childiae]KAF3062370.1 putative toxin biosynthesis protein [Daldinia childiae]
MATPNPKPFPFHITEHTIPSQHIREFPRATSNSQEDILYISIKQYTPIDNPAPQPGDITILGAHANGFPKELYEPLWADLHARSKAHGIRIRGIWIADVSNQGYSGQINESALGNDPSWHDHARDLLHLTNVFRASMPRPIVGVGHSFGGAVLTKLSLLHPRLLTTLVLLDPTVTEFTFGRFGPGKSAARASTFRRETWPSRAAAAESFRRSPFYRTWDPRVLDAWIAHAVRETPTALFPDPEKDGGATLRTTKHQEVFTFFRPLWPYVDPVTREVDRDGAPDFDPDVQAQLRDPASVFPFYRSEGGSILKLYLRCGRPCSGSSAETAKLGVPEGRKLKTETCGIGEGGSGGLKLGRVDQVVLEGRGHLFPMEIPDECAKHAATWIGKRDGAVEREGA